MGKVVLTGKGRRWIRGGHPWIFADDIAERSGEPGELLPVHDPNDNVVGWGLFSTHSRIAVRLVSRSPEQPTREFWDERMRRTVDARSRAGLLDPADACRLVSGDADGFPGFVVDRYRDVLVVQSGCQGSDRMRDFLLEVLEEALPIPVRAVLDRSDSSVRRLENLEKRVEWIRGSVTEPLIVREPLPAERVAGSDVEHLSYEVDLEHGHKTGHYLDQRLNRSRAGSFAAGRRVLDAFAYDGLFGLHAALAGAESVLCIEQNAAAGERLLRNAERNGVADRIEFLRGNAMTELRRLSQEGTSFGMAVVDPPAFARNRSETEGALRGYRELNLRAMKMLEQQGILVTCSCSYNVRREDFQKVLAASSFDADRDAYLLEMAGAGPDHPALLTLPESAYLKCAFLRIV